MTQPIPSSGHEISQEIVRGSDMLSAREQERRARRTRMLMSALLLSLVVIVGACNQTTPPPARLTSTSSATATLPALPAFSDWRVVYSTTGGLLHAVSLDGANDVRGNNGLSGAEYNGFQIYTAGFSPDGHALSYSTPAGLEVLDATGRLPAHTFKTLLAYGQSWSLDSTLLAIERGDGVSVLHLSDGALTTVPPSSSLLVSQILGWTDSTRLVVLARTPSILPTAAPDSTPTPVSSGDPGSTGPQSVTLYLLDITSGALHPFVTLPSTTTGLPSFVLAPDGQTVLYDNRPFRDHPFVPDVALIDVKTGGVTHLPHSAAATGSWFTGVAFLPGTHTIAVSAGFFELHRYKSWLLDTAHDTATPLAATAGVAVGWAPGTHILIFSTGTQAGIGSGPYQISAVPDALTNPQAKATILTTSAWSFPWLGFAKTA